MDVSGWWVVSLLSLLVTSSPLFEKRLPTLVMQKDVPLSVQRGHCIYDG